MVCKWKRLITAELLSSVLRPGSTWGGGGGRKEYLQAVLNQQHPYIEIQKLFSINNTHIFSIMYYTNDIRQMENVYTKNV